MKIAIVMTAYNREALLQKTLESFNQYDPYEFVVVTDKDEDHLEKTWVNSAIAFNRAFYEAIHTHQADAVILQNAECYHAGDILGYVRNNLTDKNYISFPCYSLGENDTLPPIEMNPRGAAFDGDSAWYNHPVHRPVGYHFCAAITTDNLRKINGFDERFKDRKDYEDNYLLYQVRQLGLRIEIPAEPYVFHQWHYSSPRKGASNEQLYNQLIQTEGYRAVHLITPDL
jgi:GT2 family glycosyltransferase